MSQPRLNLVQMAGMLARDDQFQAMVSEFVEGPMDAMLAARFIRVVCEVESRRELATNAEAAQRFHDLIRKPFIAWKEQQTETARG